MVNFLRRSALSLTVTVSLFSGVLYSNQAQACSADPMLATMCVFAGNFAPRGFAFTDGQLLPVSANSALFALLGTTYGGDGRSNFALPDTRGRSVIGARRGPGLSNYELGQTGGFETVTLTEAQIPTITPTATVHAQSAAGNNADPAGHVWAVLARQNIYSNTVPDVTMNPGAVTVNPFGGGQPHENRSPFIAMNWIIATEGIFPSRE
jgi:microcystin-dependent protein